MKVFQLYFECMKIYNYYGQLKSIPLKGPKNFHTTDFNLFWCLNFLKVAHPIFLTRQNAMSCKYYVSCNFRQDN